MCAVVHYGEVRYLQRILGSGISMRCCGATASKIVWYVRSVVVVVAVNCLSQFSLLQL